MNFEYMNKYKKYSACILYLIARKLEGTLLLFTFYFLRWFESRLTRWCMIASGTRPILHGFRSLIA